MQVTRQGLRSAAAQIDIPPDLSSTRNDTPLRVLLIEAGFVGGVFLALALLVVASVGL